MKKTVISEDFVQHADFLHAIPNLFVKGQGETIYCKRNEIRRFTHQGQVFIVKRYKKVNILQRFVYTFFRPTKAKRAYSFAQEFRQRGIDTPREVAYMETGNWRLFSIGYFVSLEAKGTESHLLLREVEHYSAALAEAVARQVVLMHSRGVLHGDLNLSNFLCTTTCCLPSDSVVTGDSPEHYSFQMIDINRSHFTDGWPTDEQCLANMVRLTHRRDLYEDLVRRYAALRGWDTDATAQRALTLLDRFEHRRIKL